MGLCRDKGRFFHSENRFEPGILKEKRLSRCAQPSTACLPCGAPFELICDLHQHLAVGWLGLGNHVAKSEARIDVSKLAPHFSAGDPSSIALIRLVKFTYTQSRHSLHILRKRRALTREVRSSARSYRRISRPARPLRSAWKRTGWRGAPSCRRGSHGASHA